MTSNKMHWDLSSYFDFWASDSAQRQWQRKHVGTSATSWISWHLDQRMYCTYEHGEAFWDLGDVPNSVMISDISMDISLVVHG
jgi:hypothetical protein